MFMMKRQMRLTLLFGLIGAMIQDTHSLSSTIIKPMQKQHLLFFPARFQQPVPRELYSNFISKLNGSYEVHIATTNTNENNELLDQLAQQTDDNIGLISHSSGVVDLWNTYSSSLTRVNIDKIILIEPLDLQKGRGMKSASILPSNFWDEFNFNMEADMEMIQLDKLNDRIEEIIETDYMELLKSNILGRFKSQKKTKRVHEEEDQQVISRERGKMLVVKHKQSDKWKFVPTIPPLSLLNADLMDFQDHMTIDEVLIDKFSHFDILDRPWANLMNRASLNKNKKQEELDAYLELLDDIVFQLMS